MTISPEMRAVADKLLGWLGTSHLGASDVLIWARPQDQVGVAFQGDALRIQRAVLDTERQMMRNASYTRGGLGHLDSSLQKALGVEVGRRLDTPDAYYQDVLGMGVDSAVAAALGIEDHLVSATLMPMEGSPWVPGERQTEYYSAKKRKVLVTPAPKWVLEGEFRDPATGEYEKGLVADVCELTPKLETERTGDAVVGRLKGMAFFSSHSFGIGRRGEASTMLASIKRCGGLLYPSLAVSHLPASIFGPISLFTDVRLPLLAVKPYKQGRGRYPVVLYTHDVWTETTRAFLGHFARELFLQLTGNAGNNVRHMAVLGPELGGGASPVDDDKIPVVQATAKLAAVLAKRMKLWNEKVVDVDKVRDQHWNQPERYPYLEAKVHARLSLDVFRLATAPEPLKDEALAFLREAGYRGPLALVQLGDVKLEDVVERQNDQAIYQYSWAVRRAVLEVAAKEPRMAVDVLT